jgi:chromosome segregation ATPase
MSGMRRHRSTKKAYDDLATPRVSNHHGSFANNDFDSGSSPHEHVNGTRRRSRSSSQHSYDAMKVQHYQYQEDTISKQQYMQNQVRLQHQHRNYSEERQTTSDCSRNSNLTPRDDSIGHWCTPPRSNVYQLDSVDIHPRYSRNILHAEQLQYYPGNISREGRKSRMERSQSTGVADMSRMIHQSQIDPISEYGKDDSYVQQLSDQDSKKTKSSKGLLSRASHKLKKRLGGSTNSSSGSEGKIKSNERGRSLSVDVSTAQFIREGRDPSPSGSRIEKRHRMRSLDDEQQNNSLDVDVGTGPFYDDQGNLVEDFQSVDFSDMSTLESNFTYPIGDVVVNSPWARERQAANNLSLGTPPRVPKAKGGAATSSITRSASERSHGSMQNIERRQRQSYPVMEGQSSVSDERSVHASLMKEMKEKLDLKSYDSSRSNNVDDSMLEQHAQLIHKNSRLSTEVDSLRQQQRDADSSSVKSSISELESKVLRLEADLRKKEEEALNVSKQKSDIERELDKSTEALVQLSNDLDSYKKECASHRERILQSERENAKMEQLVYNERKKVLSLETENQMLLNLADEKIGNANNAEKAKQSEMSAYKEQCKKYRDRVIQLERKLITSESALEATGRMATALEEDKKAMAAALDERTSVAESLKVELEENKTKLHSVERELASLHVKWTSVEGKFGSSSDDKERTITMLESENFTLLRKLDAQSSTLERMQSEEEKHRQLESEYKLLKKRNDELQLNDADMRKQLIDAQDAASISERLQKSIADSEAFITSLQNDIAVTRTKHHQQLLEIRSKHIAEIDNLSEELHKEKQAKREAEKEIGELEDKILSLETIRDQLEQQLTSQSKAHADQTARLTQQFDETREKLSSSREEANNLKRECSNNSHDHECLVNELRTAIEQQQAESCSTIGMLKKKLEAKSKEVQQLQSTIEERERSINSMQSDLSLQEHLISSENERFNEVISQLRENLESVANENEVLRASKAVLHEKIQATKSHLLDSVIALRREKVTLASEVQSQMNDSKIEIIKYVNGEVIGYCRKGENHQLNQAMNHQVALSYLKSEQSKLERLLQEESNKSQSLQKSIDSISADREEALKTMRSLSSKLSVPEKDVIDKVEDILIELSDARSEIATISIDLTTTKSELAKVNHDNQQLSLDTSHLKNVLELTTSQMKETEASASDARDSIAHLKQTLAEQEEECANIKSKTSDEISRLKKLSNEAKSQCMSLQCQLETLQTELSLANNDRASLNEQLEEKTQTIHNLNDLLSRASQDAADDLANHYMKIEDDLRSQLQTMQCEKEESESRMKRQHEKALVEIEGLQTAKHELADCVDRLSADLECAQNQVMEMELEMSGLKEEYSHLMREGSSSSKQIQNLTSTIKKLNIVHVSSEREYNAEVSRIADELIQNHSAEMDKANSLISDLKDALEEQNMSVKFYKSELEAQKTRFLEQIEDKTKELSDLRDKMDQISASKSALEESHKTIVEACSEKEELITQLKSSLRDALQNALQSDASKRESHDTLAEISDTLSSYDQVEECASSLSGSLSGMLHLKSTIERLISGKEDLETQLVEKESMIANLESKLLLINQVNENLREEANAQKVKLNRLEDENKERLADQKWMEERVKTMQTERQKEAATCSDLVLRMEKELEKAKRNEEGLMEQIMVLRQDCDIEYLYKELLDKMKEKELQFESDIQKITAENYALKKNVDSLFEENKTLLHAHDEANANSSSLTQRLDDSNANVARLVEKLAFAGNELNALRRNALPRDCANDEVSTASSIASHILNQTASDLDSTIKAIKKHHSAKVQELQSELDEIRTRWKASEQRVQELTKLLQENSKVIDALHKKLTKMKDRSKRKDVQLPLSLRQST